MFSPSLLTHGSSRSCSSNFSPVPPSLLGGGEWRAAGYVLGYQLGPSHHKHEQGEQLLIIAPKKEKYSKTLQTPHAVLSLLPVRSYYIQNCYNNNKKKQLCFPGHIGQNCITLAMRHRKKKQIKKTPTSHWLYSSNISDIKMPHFIKHRSKHFPLGKSNQSCQITVLSLIISFTSQITN